MPTSEALLCNKAVPAQARPAIDQMQVKVMKIKSTAAAILMTFLMVSGLVAGAAAPASAAGTTYYVSAAGSDSNSGTASTSAWKTLSKVNLTVLRPGDTVSFRRGDTLSGGIVTAQSGTSTAPITLSGYGTGNAPASRAESPETASGSTATTPPLTASAPCPAATPESASPATAILCGTPVRPTMLSGIKIGAGSDFGKYTGNSLDQQQRDECEYARHQLRQHRPP